MKHLSATLFLIILLSKGIGFNGDVQSKLSESKNQESSTVEGRKPEKKIPPDLWNEPVDPERLNGRIHRTFMSKTLGEEVGYLIYLPPSYEREKEKRFPVIYWLHGVRGGY